MGIAYNPKIVTNGLVFAYDMYNPQKSWKGAPTTNLQLPNIIDWSTTAVITTLSELSPIGTPVYSVTDNNISSYLSATRNITVLNNSNTYTISIYIKKTFGATSARLGFNSGFTGGTTAVQLNQRFNSDTGIGNVGSSQDLGNWWRWQFQLTNNSTGNTTLYCSFFPATGFYNSSDNAAATGTAIVSAIQTEQQSFATPFVDGTRSNTQAILDLTNNNTVTATSLTYASNNTFSFNGVDNRIAMSQVGNTSSFSYEVFLEPTQVSKDQMYIGYSTFSAHYVRITGSKAFLSVSTTTAQRTLTHSETLVDNQIYHIVSMYNGVQLKIYVNGVLSAGTVLNEPLNGWGTNRIGRWSDADQRSFVGNIYSLKIYDRELSAQEIQQNFGAFRGRFEI